MNHRSLRGVALVLMSIGGCTRAPKLVEYDSEINRIDTAPIVVVGVVDQDEPVGAPVPARHDPSYPMQLHRARVQVENVLEGSVNQARFFVYYFGFGGGFNGPRPLYFRREPSRRVLWLRKDQGVYRMACDGWDYCSRFVESGAHTAYRPSSDKPLDYALADILLTRGEGRIDDLHFVSEILNGVPDNRLQDYVIEKLARLAKSEKSPIKDSACVQLKIYTIDRIGDDLHRQAQKAIDVANCVCDQQPPHGMIVCH